MTEIEMTLPNFFYAEPRFRASSPDIAKLKGASEWTLDTPGISFALALDYYRVEAYATRKDRDAACGPTAHEDVQYRPASRKDIARGDITLDDIACGHAIDHSRFAEVLGPIFDAALKRLIGDVVEAPKDQGGIIATAVIPVARARYKISAVRNGDWIRFPVEGLAAFEKIDGELMDQTVTYLQDRLTLQMSPSLIGMKCS
jgi:hypothetical protein